MPDTHYVPTAHVIDAMPRRRQGRPEASTLVLTMTDNTTPQTKHKPHTRKAQPPEAANTTNRPGDDVELERLENDAKLWSIVHDLRSVAKEGNSHDVLYPASIEIEDDINARREALFKELFATPAQTVFGIAAKLHATVWPWFTERHDQLDPPVDADGEYTRRVWEIITEAEALGRPCRTNGTSTIPALGLTFQQAAERLDALIAEMDAIDEDTDPSAEARVEKLVEAMSNIIMALAGTEPRTIGDCLAVLRVAAHPTSPVRDSDVYVPGTGAEALFNALLRGAALLPTLLSHTGVNATASASVANPGAQPAAQAADAELVQAWQEFLAFDAYHNGSDVHSGAEHEDELVQADQDRWRALAERVAQIPAASVAGLAIKAKLALVSAMYYDGNVPLDWRFSEWDWQTLPPFAEGSAIVPFAFQVVTDAERQAQAASQAACPDAFADAVAAFEAEAPTTLALPQAPTDAMAQAAASAADITPEQFASAYAAAVEAFKQEAAA